MEHFPDFENDVEFTERLIAEQSVFCLPATVRLFLHGKTVSAGTVMMEILGLASALLSAASLFPSCSFC